MKQFIVFVCGFVLICSNLLFADDFYWSCGHKKYVTLQTDYALIQTEKISEKAAQTLYKLQADKIEFPKEYKQLSGGWSLLRVDAKQLRNQVINQQILLVYKDKRGKLVLPTRDIVVRLKEKIDDSSVKKLAQRHGVSVKKINYPLPGTAMLTVPASTSEEILKISNAIHDDEKTTWAHPDVLPPFYKRGTVNDPLFSIQWHLTNDGHLATSVAGADAKVAGAWDTTMGNSNIRICVFDDSVEKDHEDLAPNFVSGLNLPDMGPDPSPQIFTGEYAEFHGSACAGVAVARGNNSIGVSGAAPNCSLMGIRWGNAPASADAAAFYWARTNGADVISCSWGTDMDTALFEGIKDAAENGRNGLGCVILFAAGNSDASIGANDPARHPDIICVVASNCKDERASYSSYGSTASIAAPSNDDNILGITTTDITGTRGYSSDNYCRATDNSGFGGTSSSTPLAAGIVGLCLSVNPNLTREEVKSLLQETADKIDSGNYPYSDGWNQYLGYGRINAFRAVQMADNTNSSAFVTPMFSFNSSGNFGGPFAPLNKVYTLNNPSNSNLTWTANCPSNWIDLSSGSGTIPTGSTTTVTVTINSSATNFVAGQYGSIVLFSNTVSGIVESRNISLVVNSTSVTSNITFYRAKGKASDWKGKFKAKLYSEKKWPFDAGFNGSVFITLDGQDITDFGCEGDTPWKWNKKGTRGKMKNLYGDKMIIMNKPGKYFLKIIAKNLLLDPFNKKSELVIDFEKDGNGSILLNLDENGKFNQ